MGLWKLLSDEADRAFRAWAITEFERDPEQPVMSAWHPVIRAEWATLMSAKARIDLATTLEPDDEDTTDGFPEPQMNVALMDEGGVRVSVCGPEKLYDMMKGILDE